tara:strand:+ start:71 stop:499 length:429 start_codon:yes stop_codon:yes gene_type:complete
MKKTLYFLIGILAFSCVNKPDSKKKSDIALYSKLNPIEIKYSDSREKTIENLKLIWECKKPLIAKSETNFNGKTSNDITLMIPEFKLVDSEKKERNIKLTSDLIKKDILNYQEFSELKIITSFTTSEGEIRTSSNTKKTTEL